MTDLGHAGYEIRGGAVVSGSFQAFDQSYLEAALQELGPGFVGVTQLPATSSDAEIQRLHKIGVRAVRFNLRRGAGARAADLESFARRVRDLVGWHVELYVDSRDLLGEDGGLSPLARTVARLPAASIDHLGLSAEGLPALLRLVEQDVRVKATGFGRLDFNVADALRAITRANPAALMFGTDLPGTRAPRAFHSDDIALIRSTLGDTLARKVLYENACEFYRVNV
jgi:predicted TIM-barrel fold metal-dependent hydrolase